MAKSLILGFAKRGATVQIGTLAERETGVSPYNYQDTPKSVVKALAAGKGVTSTKVVIDGEVRFGGICVGRNVGPERSALPGTKINVFWVTPQEEKTHERNSYQDAEGKTVNHRTDWIAISAAELAEIKIGGEIKITRAAVTPAVAAVETPKEEPKPEAPAKPAKGKKAERV